MAKSREEKLEYLKEYRRKKGLTRLPKEILTKERKLEISREYNKRHYYLYKERMVEMSRQSHLKRKRKCIEGYGSKCSSCGETEFEFLTIDHVLNDGAKHRAEIGNVDIYTWAERNGFPDSLQCLCFSCNIEKSVKARRKDVVSPSGYTQRRKREKILNHYGAKCSCCEEDNEHKLAIDHIDGGGCKHRKSTKNNIYKEIIDRGFPPTYRILCANCNHSARVGNGVCIHKRAKVDSKISHYREIGIINKYDNMIDISESLLDSLRIEKDNLPQFIADAILECGMPYPEKRSTPEHALEDFKKLYGITCYIEKNQATGLVCSNHFHERSMWESPDSSGVRPVDAWKDPKVLLKVCKGIALAKGHGITNTNLRRYFLLNVGLPSQFRPAVAKALYERYANGGRVFDPCSGWGDRLAGFWASSATEYVGVDPNSSLPEGYAGQQKMYSTVVKKKCTMIQSGIEDVTPEDVGEFDFGFTSPPYWNTEKYSKDAGQSSVRWGTYGEWKDGFLRHLVEIMFKTCKVFSINVGEIKHYDLIGDTVALAESFGASLIDTHKYMLPRRPSDKSGVERFEPILVFK